MSPHRTTLGWILLAILVTSLLGGCVPPYPIPPTSTPSPTPTLTPTASPVPPAGDPLPTRLAWFYKPPLDDADLLMIAHEFNFFILSRGDEPKRDQMLKLGAQRPILEYIRFDAIHDPHSCDARPRQNQAAYQPGDFCRISQDHPDWFLLDQAGARIILPMDDQDYVMMDPGNPGWRAFFLERVQVRQSDPNWDGVFLDNVEVTFSFREDHGQLPRDYPDEASYQNAVQGFLQYIYTSYFQPEHVLLFANIVARKDEAAWPTYLTWLDGAMHEGWAVDWPNRFRDVQEWEQQMTLAEQTQQMGKFIILIAHGERADLEVQRFAFASYLLINQGQAAFRYAQDGSYREPWFYPDYYFDLGVPLGPRYQDGDAWYRDFTKGRVMVNPVTHESQITVY